MHIKAKKVGKAMFGTGFCARKYVKHFVQMFDSKVCNFVHARDCSHLHIKLNVAVMQVQALALGWCVAARVCY